MFRVLVLRVFFAAVRFVPVLGVFVALVGMYVPPSLSDARTKWKRFIRERCSRHYQLGSIHRGNRGNGWQFATVL
jgi:hypothetical protein